MALHYDLPVYKASYDLLLEIFKFTKEFTKEFKYTMGESLKKETLDLLTLIFRANSKTDKQATLQEGSVPAGKLHVRSVSKRRVVALLFKSMKHLGESHQGFLAFRGYRFFYFTERQSNSTFSSLYSKTYFHFDLAGDLLIL